MVELSAGEKFIIEKFKENGGDLNYKEFEVVRLILKKFKKKQIISYGGVITEYTVEITLKNYFRFRLFIFNNFFYNF